jgi:lipoyl(octanoyl) transferase
LSFGCRNYHTKDLLWYLRQIEEVIIRVLAENELEGFRDSEYTGVWVEDEGKKKKVAAIGVNVSRWVTMHGFSINVNNDLAGFGRIVPCGIDEKDRDVVTLKQLLGDAHINNVKQQVLDVFANNFEVDIQTRDKH